MAWQTRERGLQLSRTPHARSSCIIVKFRTIAWRTQILASDSQVRSYEERTVSVEWSLRCANCKRFTHIRPTDGIAARTVAGVCGEPLKAHGAWTDSRSTVGFKAFLFYFEFSLGGGPKQNTSTQNTSTVNRFRSFSAVKPVGNRLLHQQTHANVKRTG